MLLTGTTNRRPYGASIHPIYLAAITILVPTIVCNMMGCSLAADAMIIDTQLERFRIRDICNTNNRNMRLYLDYGDSGWVNGYARSHQLEHVAEDFAVKTLSRPKHHGAKPQPNRGECTLELVTCPSCRIKVTTSLLNIANYRHCGPQSSTTQPIAVTNSNWTNENSSGDDDETSRSGNGGSSGITVAAGDAAAHHSATGNCKCNYISFVEPPFDTPAGNGQRICNDGQPSPSVYTGHTRSLLIHFSLAQSMPEDVFNLTVLSERNLDQTSGSPTNDPRRLADRTHRPDAVIVSPFFPAASPRDLIKQHLITCTAASGAPTTTASTACSIRVLFTDYQIDRMSRLEFFNADGDLIQMHSGMVFRPPVMVCDGPSLLMRFYANGGSALRYRAEVDFLPAAAQLAVLPDGVQDLVRPLTECGGSVDTLGGAITMMNMVANETQRVRYDCVWLVRPSSRYLNAMPNLSLRVDSFEGFVEQSELSIHEGLTSVHPQLGTIQWAGVHQKKQRINVINEYVLPTSTGFYVRFQGTFGALSKLALVYTVFSYESKTATQFECQNRKRIPLQLQCDGFDHCGDNSDELDTCQLAWKHDTYDRRLYSHTPNYYFPKTEQYPDMRAATIVFLVSTIGLVFLVVGIVVLLYRMGHWTRDHRDLHGHLNTISELLDSQQMDEEEDIAEDLDPPAYEAPPAYDEVIQVGMDKYYLKATICPTTMPCKERQFSCDSVSDAADSVASVSSGSSSNRNNGCRLDMHIDSMNMTLETGSDGNLVSLSSLENLTTPCHATNQPTNSSEIELSNSTSDGTTVIEILTPISVSSTSIPPSHMTGDQTMDSVVVQTTETSQCGKSTESQTTKHCVIADPLWSLIESVSNDLRNGASDDSQQLFVVVADELQPAGDDISITDCPALGSAATAAAPV